MIALEQISQNFQRLGSERSLSMGGLGPDMISYERLCYHVHAVSARLQQAGVTAGSLYGVRYDEPLMHVALLLALERAGAATTTIRELCDDLGLAGVFSDREMPDWGCPVIRAGRDWLSPGGDSIASVPPAVSSDAVCRVALTSGSTGKPKMVAMTHAMLAERSINQDRAFGEIFGQAKRRLCLVGIGTMFGYRILMRTLAEGGLFCFPEADIPRTVRRIAMYGVQALLGSPLQLAQYADYAEKHPESFPSLELVVCIGSRLSPTLAEHL